DVPRMAVRIRFRGVRGSVPYAVPDAAVHGCNTACLEITDERTGAILIVDAGSGIVGVTPEASDVSLLLTHYHWDHVQALPFFAPLYQEGRRVTIHAPDLQGRDAAWLETLFRAPFFPIPSDRLPARPPQRIVT